MRRFRVGHAVVTRERVERRTRTLGSLRMLFVPTATFRSQFRKLAEVFKLDAKLLANIQAGTASAGDGEVEAIKAALKALRKKHEKNSIVTGVIDKLDLECLGAEDSPAEGEGEQKKGRTGGKAAAPSVETVAVTAKTIAATAREFGFLGKEDSVLFIELGPNAALLCKEGASARVSERSGQTTVTVTFPSK